MPEVLGDVMQTGLPCVDTALPVSELDGVLSAAGSDRVVVLADGRLLGVVLASQLDRHVSRCSATTAGDLAGRHVLTASESTPIAKAFEAFQGGVDRFVVVLRAGVPVGSVRPCDLFSWMGENAGGHAIRRPHFLDGSANRASRRPAG